MREGRGEIFQVPSTATFRRAHNGYGHNVPLGAIQRLVGHENRKTTEIYLHSIGDLEREAIAVFEYARETSHTDSHTAEAHFHTFFR